MKFIKSILRGLFGSFAWQAPRWWAAPAQRVANFVAWARANRALAAGSGAALLAVTAIAVGGAWWWKNRPQPQYTAISLTVPSAMDLDDVSAKPLPLVLEFSDSVAPLSNIDKTVTAGVALSPVIDGVWTWNDETHLSFRPRQDWPVGESYRVQLQTKQLLRTGAALKEDTLNFKSPEFTANVTNSEFYQDPTEPQLKKVVVTVKFSHPVDARSFEDHFRLRFKDQKPGVLGLGAETTAYEVNYSDKHNYAYVRSRALALPDVPTEMLAKLEEGVRSSRGGPGIGSPIEVSVKVPGRFSLQPEDTSLTFVSNDRLETDQILNITMSEGVSPEELRKHLKAY